MTQTFESYIGIINVMDYGAMPDADNISAYAANNSAFARAIAAARHTDYGQIICIPPGDYYISDTVAVESVLGLHIQGCGMSSRLLWHGATGIPALKIQNSRQCQIDYLGIEAVSELTIGIQMLRHDPASFVPTQNRFDQVKIDKAITSVRIGSVDGRDANNDFNHFYDCEFNGYTEYAVDQSDSSQSYQNIFENCKAQAGVGGKSAVFTGTVGGGFMWRGGGVGANTVSDFQIGRSSQISVIDFCNSEGSNRFVQNFNSLMGAVSIRNCRVALNALNVDGQVVLLTAANWPYLCNAEIANCSFWYEPENVECQFNVGWGATGNGGFIFTNNVVHSTAIDVFSDKHPDLKYGNVRVTNADNMITEPL
jgi:hypothetical protein